MLKEYFLTVKQRSLWSKKEIENSECSVFRPVCKGFKETWEQNHDLFCIQYLQNNLCFVMRMGYQWVKR